MSLSPCPHGNSHQNLKHGWSTLQFTKPLVFTIAQADGCYDPYHWRVKSAEVERGWAARVQISALPLASCVMLGQLLNPSVLQFLHVKNRDYNNSDNSTYFTDPKTEIYKG